MQQITTELLAFRDEQYRQFHSRLMPEIDPETIIGVRTPILRKYAKELVKREDVETFLNTLPHQFYEENNLHGELLKLKYKDLNTFLEKLEVFLPYIDNWGTCDMLSPKIFKKNLYGDKKNEF